MQIEVYLKKNIKQTAKNLIRIHKTKNIYKLYEYYGINIIYGNFNKNLSTKKKEIILIHEFAHFIFHKNYLLHR